MQIVVIYGIKMYIKLNKQAIIPTEMDNILWFQASSRASANSYQPLFKVLFSVIHAMCNQKGFEDTPNMSFVNTFHIICFHISLRAGPTYRQTGQLCGALRPQGGPQKSRHLFLPLQWSPQNYCPFFFSKYNRGLQLHKTEKKQKK